MRAGDTKRNTHRFYIYIQLASRHLCIFPYAFVHPPRPPCILPRESLGPCENQPHKILSPPGSSSWFSILDQTAASDDLLPALSTKHVQDPTQAVGLTSHITWQHLSRLKPREMRELTRFTPNIYFLSQHAPLEINFLLIGQREYKIFITQQHCGISL